MVKLRKIQEDPLVLYFGDDINVLVLPQYIELESENEHITIYEDKEYMFLLSGNEVTLQYNGYFNYCISLGTFTENQRVDLEKWIGEANKEVTE